jgi:hypothetical protein
MNDFIFLSRKKFKITLFFVFIIISFGMTNCAKKKLKPWDNPELTQLKKDSFDKFVSDTTWFGNGILPNGKLGAKFKIYFNPDGTSELWVPQKKWTDEGVWRIDENNDSVCTSYKHLRSGQEACRLIFRIGRSQKLEIYDLNGNLKNKIREITLGYDM